MKQIYSTLLLLVLLIFPSLLFATEPECVDRVPAIRGVVYDETDTPLASATVQIEGTTIGTTTNSEGRFILRNLARKVYKINVSFVGYATQTRTVDLTSRSVAQLSFTLLPDDNYPNVRRHRSYGKRSSDFYPERTVRQMWGGTIPSCLPAKILLLHW